MWYTKEKEGDDVHSKNSEITIEVVGDGVTRRILSYSDKIMVVELNFKSGAAGTMHEHYHEQVIYVVSGKIAYREEGKPDTIMTAGDSYYIAPNLVHGALALEDSKILDIFTPAREDFLKK